MHRQQLESVFRLERFDLIFTICREPMARFLSEYRYRNSKNLERLSAEDWFDETVERYKDDPSVYDNHFRPQSDFLLDNCRVFKLEENPELALDAVRQIADRPGTGKKRGSGGAAKSSVVGKVQLWLEGLVTMDTKRQPHPSNNRAGFHPHVSESLRQKVVAFYSVDYAALNYPA